jgi:hypothetical protein
MLTMSDDLPIHQSAEPFARIGSHHPRWTERWYFNIQAEDGTLLGICGGGFYPNTGVLEVYGCALADSLQVNIRQRVTEFDRTHLGAASAVQFEIREPMRVWAMSAQSSHFSFELEFESTAVPYLFPAFFVAADHGRPGVPVALDTIQHFAQPGRVRGRWTLNGDTREISARSFRDRTWGIRSARPRLHNWYVLHLEDDSSLYLVHQERADGSAMVSHIGRVGLDGSVATAVIDAHELDFEPDSRLLRSGVITAHGADGAPVTVQVRNVGPGVRLLGAGYTAAQGAADALGDVQSDTWDLSDERSRVRYGRGTIDSPIVATLTWGARTVSGFGISETAIARDHWRYGRQLTMGEAHQ